MKKVIYIILALIAVSCSGKKRAGVVSDYSVVKVTIDAIANDVIDPAKYIDSVRYIRLETTPDSPVALVSNILFADSLIIISESQTKSVFIFDDAGKYLRAINKRGRGPGEYLTLSNTMVDPTEKHIMIYDGNSRKLLYYDFKGAFLKSIDDFSNKDVVRDMINLPDGGFLCYCPDALSDGTPARLWYVDKNGVAGDNLYAMNDTYPLKLPQNPYSLYHLSDGNIGFTEFVSSDIYKYDGDSLCKHTSYRLPGKNFSDLKGTSELGAKTSFINMNSESDKYIITEITDDKSNYGIIAYSKERGEYDTGVVFAPYFNNRIIVGGIGVRNNIPGVRTSVVRYSMLNNYVDSEFSQYTPDNIKSFIRDTLICGMTPQQITDANPVIQMLYIKNY